MNDVAPKDRDIAMVFQNYALYPHMTVYENMAFAAEAQEIARRTRTARRISRNPNDEVDRREREAARFWTSPSTSTASPRRSPAASASAWPSAAPSSVSPKVFLMDEPLSNLDAKLRNQMRAEIIKLRETHRHHLHLRHARSGRGHDPRRPHRHHDATASSSRSARRRRCSTIPRTCSSPASSARRR